MKRTILAGLALAMLTTLIPIPAADAQVSSGWEFLGACAMDHWDAAPRMHLSQLPAMLQFKRLRYGQLVRAKPQLSRKPAEHKLTPRAGRHLGLGWQVIIQDGFGTEGG